MLRNRRTGEILKVFNSNVETADIIWSGAMREQLEAHVKSIEKQRPDNIRMAEEELELLGNFEYDALKHKIRLGAMVSTFAYSTKWVKMRSAASRTQPLSAISVVTFIAIRHLNESSSDENWIKIRLRRRRRF